MKAKVLAGVTSAEITRFAKETLRPGTRIRSDGLHAYHKLAEEYEIHQQVFDHKENPDYLKWLHIIISNAKAFVLGTYHGLDSKHLQLYLDEFCFRFARRFWQPQLFNRILCACAHSSPFTRYDLIG